MTAREVQELEATFVRCRTYGHGWDEFAGIDIPANVTGWQLHLRCTRCKTQRHDVISSKGEVAKRHYKYPHGYRLSGKVDRPQLRRQLKVIVFADVASMRRRRG